MFRQGSPSEAGAATGAASSSSLFRRTVQTRIRPLLLSNVRRSSVGNAIPFNTNRPAAASVFMTHSSQGASASNDNQGQTENKSGDDESTASFTTVAAAQGFASLADEGASASPVGSKGSKKSFFKRISKLGRRGSKRSSSSVNSGSVATSSGTANDELDITVMEEIVEEDAVLENLNNTDVKTKKKGKFPKVFLCFRRIRKSLGRKQGIANLGGEGAKSIQLVEPQVDETTGIVPGNDSESFSGGKSPVAGNVQEEEAVGGGSGAMVISSGARSGEFIVTVVPEGAGQSEIERLQEGKPGQPGLLERSINLMYYMGLCPFRFDEKCRIVTSCFSKGVYLTVNCLAMLFEIGQIRVLYALRFKDVDVDSVYYFILMASEASIVVLQARLFQYLWFEPKGVQRTVMADRRCPVTNFKSASWIALGLRIYSTVASFASAFGGFGMIHYLSIWTWKLLLQFNEGIVYTGFLQEAHRFKNSLAGNSSAAIFNTSTTTEGAMYSTILATDAPEIEEGWFIQNGALETVIIGSFGLFMNVCNHMVTCSAVEMVSSCVGTLWGGMKNLKLHKIMRSQRNETDHATDTPRDIDTEDETYTEEQQEEVIRTSGGYESLRRLCSKMNDGLKYYWPWLALATLLLLAFILFNLAEQRWYTALGLSLQAIPVFVCFYLGIKLAMESDDFNYWISTERAQSVLKSTAKQFEMKLAQLLLQPFGFGTGAFYIGSAFLVGFFGASVSYFLTQNQAAHTQNCVT